MTTLLVEDLLLLTAHPGRGTVRRPSGLALPRALAGAFIDDLAASGAARVPGSRLLLAVTPPAHPLLAQLFGRLAGHRHTLDSAIEALARPRARLGQAVLRSLTAGGAVVRHDARVLGVVPLAWHVAADLEAVQELRARVAAASRTPLDDDRASALARLVAAAELYRSVGVEPMPPVRRRALVAADLVATEVAATIRRARRDASTGAAVATAAAVVSASGS